MGRAAVLGAALAALLLIWVGRKRAKATAKANPAPPPKTPPLGSLELRNDNDNELQRRV
jgi:hypothetical protein